jgi:Na+-driven multidrug efflux pump
VMEIGQKEMLQPSLINRDRIISALSGGTITDTIRVSQLLSSKQMMCVVPKLFPKPLTRPNSDLWFWQTNPSVLDPHEGESLLLIDHPADTRELAKLDLFSKAFRFSRLGKYVCYGTQLGGEVGLLSISMLANGIHNIIGQACLNSKATATDQSGFGIAVVFTWIFHYAILVAMYDKFGMEWSRAYGIGDFKLLKKSMNQGAVVLVTTLSTITLPMYLMSEKALLLAGIVAPVAKNASVVLHYMIGFVVVQTLQEFTKLFCLAQEVEAIFGLMSIIATITTSALMYWLMMVKGWGVLGLVCSKIIYESILLLVGIATTLYRTNPAGRGFVGVTTALDGICNVYYDSFKYALGSYTEYIGFMISNYFVILTHDENQIAAYSLVDNLLTITYTVGEAFATIMRTRMNILIGKNLHSVAKRFFIFFFTSNLIMALIMTMVVYFCQQKLVFMLASSNPKLSEYFSSLMYLFILYGTGSMLICTVMVGLKSTGQINFLLGWNLCLFIGVNLAACLVGRIYFDASCIYVYHVSGILAYILCWVCFIGAYTHEWQTNPGDMWTLQLSDPQVNKSLQKIAV